MKYSEAFEKDSNRKRCPRYSFVSKEITNFVFKRKKKDIYLHVFTDQEWYSEIYISSCIQLILSIGIAEFYFFKIFTMSMCYFF